MQLFKLTGQQINFLKVPACFILFFRELNESRIHGLRDTLNRGRLIPLVAFFPRMDRVLVDTHKAGNFRNRVTLPVQLACPLANKCILNHFSPSCDSGSLLTPYRPPAMPGVVGIRLQQTHFVCPCPVLPS
ncbi:hypothetical protein FGAF1022_31230 [Escherichia coli]|nr:hypothetical protein FGAF1022_31230 [Escherichia coli]